MTTSITPVQLKKITKEELISRYRSLHLSEENYSDDQLNQMTKTAILEIYNADVSRLNLIDEVRISEGFEISRETLHKGSVVQLNDFRARLKNYQEEIRANGYETTRATLPTFGLGEISVAMSGNPLTSWIYLENPSDTEIMPYLFPEVFPRVNQSSSNPGTDRVLSIVATVISSVVKKTVSKEDVCKASYAAAAITVLEKRDWNEEDAEAVGELLAQLKSMSLPASNEPFVAPCDTNAEGFSYDEKSVVCRNCPDVQICINHFQSVRTSKPSASRTKKDVFEAPSAMTRITMEIVKNPSITKDQIYKILEESGAKMPSDGTIVQQMGEALKHVRILAMLGHLKDEYKATIPTPRRDMLTNPSAVAKVAIESAREGGTRDFETVFAINQASDHPISRDAAYYQYQDSQKVVRLVKEIGVFING